MIITRTPFRISFAGGGSDLPAFYSKEVGTVLTTAINKYMYLTVKERFGNTFRVSYAQTELCEQAKDIQHPIVRACLASTGITRGLEIVSIADLPAQSGMGSSSSFTVGLLGALHALKGQVTSADQLAREACDIEINQLNEPIGKQDQYIAAYGGLQFIRFMPDGSVFVDPVICSTAVKRELNRRLMLFFMGGTREARQVLARQNANTDSNLPAIRRLCAIAYEMREVLTVGRDLNVFGRLLHEAWEVKKTLEKTISNLHVDKYYKRALDAGALGGKLLGAGSCGFILFYCEPHYQEQLRHELSDLTEIPLTFDPQGMKVIYVGEDHW